MMMIMIQNVKVTHMCVTCSFPVLKMVIVMMMMMIQNVKVTHMCVTCSFPVMSCKLVKRC